MGCTDLMNQKFIRCHWKSDEHNSKTAAQRFCVTCVVAQIVGNVDYSTFIATGGCEISVFVVTERLVKHKCLSVTF